MKLDQTACWFTLRKRNPSPLASHWRVRLANHKLWSEFQSVHWTCEKLASSSSTQSVILIAITFLKAMKRKQDSLFDWESVFSFFFFVFKSKWNFNANSFSANSISSENGPCVGTSSSARNYCNYCKMKKQTKWSALFVNLERLLSSWVHTDKADGGCS